LATQWPLRRSLWPPPNPQKSRVLATWAIVATHAGIPRLMTSLFIKTHDRRISSSPIIYYFQVVTMVQVVKAKETAALTGATPETAMATVATHFKIKSSPRGRAAFSSIGLIWCDCTVVQTPVFAPVQETVQW
jgi:hypothetical protein